MFGPPGHPTCGLRPSGLLQVPQLGARLMFTSPAGAQEAGRTGSGGGVACAVFAPQHQRDSLGCGACDRGPWPGRLLEMAIGCQPCAASESHCTSLAQIPAMAPKYPSLNFFPVPAGL